MCLVFFQNLTVRTQTTLHYLCLVINHVNLLPAVQFLPGFSLSISEYCLSKVGWWRLTQAKVGHLFTVWPFCRHEFLIKPTFQGPPCLSRHEFTFLLSLASELGKGNQSCGKVPNALEPGWKRELYSNLTLANISCFPSSISTSAYPGFRLISHRVHIQPFIQHVPSAVFSSWNCSIK